MPLKIWRKDSSGVCVCVFFLFSITRRMTSAKKEVSPESCVDSLAVVKGPYPVRFSPGCVVHPLAVIVAQRGPIYFGAYCIVEEHACIVNGVRDGDNGDDIMQDAQPMSIGSYNHFKAFSCVANVHRIGHGNQFEPHCCVEGVGQSLSGGSSPISSVEDYCVVGAFVRLSAQQRADKLISDLAFTLPSRTVLLCPKEAGAGATCNDLISFSSDCGGCWVLPRGEPFDEEEAEDALRQKCFCLCELAAREKGMEEF